MGKTGGLGDNFYLGGYDLSGDVASLDKIFGGPKPLDFTPINVEAMVREGGQRDGGMDFTTFMDPAVAHVALAGLTTADVIATYARGAVLGNPGACCNAKQVGYDPTRANDGSILLKVSMQANGYGLEWGKQLTAGLRTDTAATNGADVDDGAATAYGAQAYLQVTAFTGTDVTVKVQHSADNLTYTDLITFTQVTAANKAERQALANTTTVDRYVRAVTVTTGGFTSATFSVVFMRNPVAGVVF